MHYPRQILYCFCAFFAKNVISLQCFQRRIMHNTERFSDSLMKHQVRPTANRIILLQALEEIDRAMTLSELENKVVTIDKSGIFRTLSLFKEHGLVHVIDDGEGTKYELCRSHHKAHDDDTHVHFHCERCHVTFCLEDVPIPKVDLPDGYVTMTANYIIKGICPNCTTRRH